MPPPKLDVPSCIIYPDSPLIAESCAAGAGDPVPGRIAAWRRATLSARARQLTSQASKGEELPGPEHASSPFPGCGGFPMHVTFAEAVPGVPPFHPPGIIRPVTNFIFSGLRASRKAPPLDPSPGPQNRPGSCQAPGRHLISRLLKNPTSGPTRTRGDHGIPGDRVICSSKPRHRRGRAVDKVVMVRPSGAAMVQGAGGVLEDRGVKRWRQMRLASQTARSPVAASSVGMRRVFQQLARSLPASIASPPLIRAGAPSQELCS